MLIINVIIYQAAKKVNPLCLTKTEKCGIIRTIRKSLHFTLNQMEGNEMKKLVLTEIAITGLLIGLFILIFSFMDGWDSERDLGIKYNAAIIASFTAVIASVIIAVFNILSDDYSAIVAFGACAFAAAFGAYVVAFSNASSATIILGTIAYVVVALVTGFLAFSIAKIRLKNFFSAVSLILQGLIIVAAFTAVTFLS